MSQNNAFCPTAGDKGTFEVKQEELKSWVLVPGATGLHTQAV